MNNSWEKIEEKIGLLIKPMKIKCQKCKGSGRNKVPEQSVVEYAGLCDSCGGFGYYTVKSL